MTTTPPPHTVTPRRILIVAEAVTLAHAVRPAVMAGLLGRAGHQVTLAWAPRYASLFPELDCPTETIDSLAPADFAAALAAGRPIYSAARLLDYVAADEALLERLRPDVVMGDFRLSLQVSARRARVPYLGITNAYWSPWARQAVPVPDILPTRLLGARLMQPIFDRVRPLAFAQHARPIEAMRRRHGLPALGGDLFAAYTEADQVLYADIPGLVDLSGLPANHHVAGPVLWSPSGSLPQWWDGLSDDQPLVYVTLGSSGDPRTLPALLAALGRLRVRVLLASAGKALPDRLPANVLTADYLPGLAASARACLVVCNGGAPTTQQALAAGRPVLGICTNLDQQLNMQGIVRAGAGLSLRASEASGARLSRALDHLLADGPHHAAAWQLAARCAEADLAGTLQAAIEDALAAH
ncbi:MAG TPA: glycosyl transferase family 1 [Gammaproteobacteria bacterium]|nr:glycosyl transferase family 1 [Gammaproteobacteria bacterium]